MPSFAQSETAVRVNTGKALSSLGVNDIGEEPEPPVANVSDPIKPALYLEDMGQPQPPARVLETMNDRPQQSEPTTISGPSFLGLTDSESADDSSYLLEDERPGRRGAWVLFALIMIAVFLGIGYLEWNTVKTGKINIPFLHPNTADQPSAADAQVPPPPGTGNTASSGDANAAPQPPATPATTGAEKTSDAPLVSDESSSPANNSANDAAATESALTRQAQENQQKKAEEAKPQPPASTSSNSDAQDSGDEKPAPAVKPTARSKSTRLVAQERVEAKPDPRENRMLILGENYLYGRAGAARNCQQAVIYFHAAAEQNNAPAMSHLAAMYNTGECVKRDRVSAYSWLRRAHDADPGNQWIERNMNMVWRDMSVRERAAIHQ
jgi:cytoskeletal protein RodZ